MKYLLTITLLFNTCIAQKWYSLSKNDLFSNGLMALSGIAKGYNESILHHHFGRGNQFWDNTVSFENKYKDFPNDLSAAYFGSKTFLVWTTDGQHLTQTFNTLFLTGGTVFLSLDIKKELQQLPKKDRWKYIVFKKVLLPLIIRSAAFEITFKHL